MLVSLCLLKIEIDLSDMSDEDNVKSEGAAGANVPANSRVVREHRGQRKSKPIRIDNYTCAEMEQSSENRGILPSSSREATPMASEDNQTNANLDHMDDKTFFSGNPFVEVTKGIIHMYKKK